MQISLPRNLRSLTSLRYFAAVFIVIFHYSPPQWSNDITDFIAQFGWLGVHFFFILSGFVLMWSFDTSESKAHFYWRRMCRIYPLHLLCLIISLIAFYKIGDPLAGYAGSKLSILAAVFLVEDWVPGNVHFRQAWNGVSWSLSCEMFFYLLAPFLFALFLKNNSHKRLVLLFGIWFALLITAYSIGDRQDTELLADMIKMHPLFNLLQFCLGATAANIIRENIKIKLSWLTLLTIAASVIGIYNCYQYSEATIDLLATPGFLLIIIYVAKRDAAEKKSWLQNSYLVLLGESSFALYMTHLLLRNSIVTGVDILSGSMGRPFFLIFAVAISLILTTAFSIIIHIYVERPLRVILLKLNAKLPKR